MTDELYGILGTGIAWTDTGGDEVLDLGGLAAAAVRVGAYLAVGATAAPRLYVATIFIDGFDTAPVVGESLYLYFSESFDGGTTFTGPESPSDSADGAGAVNRLRNLRTGPFPVTVHTTTAADNLFSSFQFISWATHLAPVVHNATADALLSTSDAHVVTLYPAHWQQQS